MIGRGIPYVIVNLFRQPELFPGEPRLRFEVLGIPVYDPRRDSSVGGTGSQRWSDRATWERSDNPRYTLSVDALVDALDRCTTQQLLGRITGWLAREGNR